MKISRYRRGVSAAAVAVLATASLVLTACAAGGTDAASDDTRQLVVARANDLTTLDPGRAYCDTCQIVLNAMYDSLLAPDPADPTNVVPELATSWEVNADATSFTFHLDPEATFSDGSAVESSDVKFTFERLKNLQGSASFLLAGLASIDTPDAGTVIVNFEAPNSPFIAIAASSFLGILNADIVASNGGDSSADAATKDTAESWFLSNSAGSGAYTLGSYHEGTSIELTRNDEYWSTEPVFPSVLIKEVTDPSSQLQQLQQGDVDIAMQISPDSIPQLDGVQGVKVGIEDSYNFTYLVLQPGAEGGAPLGDPKVREAIKKAIDYDKVIKATVAGYGTTQGSPIPNGFPGSAAVDKPTYDPDGAKKLLAEAGVTDLTIDAAYPAFNAYGVDFDVMMQSIQQDLAAVGITLKLESLEYTQWADRLGKGTVPLTAVYFAPDYMDSSGYVSYFGMVPDAPWAALGTVDGPWVDDATVQGLATARTQTADAAVSSYEALAQQMAGNFIALPIVNPQFVFGYASDLTGVTYTPNSILDVTTIGLSS